MQAVYESEVRFEPKIKNPDTITLDVGNNGSNDRTVNGELIDRIVHINQFNNSLRNESFYIVANTSQTRHITVPKTADIEKATINVGDNSVTGLILKLWKEFETRIASTNPDNINKEIYLGPIKLRSRVITEGNTVNVLLEA